MHGKYVVNVVTRYDQIFYFPNLVMTRFSHVGGWQVCIMVMYEKKKEDVKMKYMYAIS